MAKKRIKLRYLDTTPTANQVVGVATANADPAYMDAPTNDGGGTGGPAVVQEAGSSTTSVMSQAASTIEDNKRRDKPMAYAVLTYAATLNVDTQLKLDYNARVTLGGNMTVAIQNPTEGQEGEIELVGHATTDYIFTIPAADLVLNTNGVKTILVAANKIVIVAWKFSNRFKWVVGK